MEGFYIIGDPEEVRAKTRLEYLREQIEKECISYEEIAELQSLAEYIEPGDVVLLELAGVPEQEESGAAWFGKAIRKAAKDKHNALFVK